MKTKKIMVSRTLENYFDPEGGVDDVIQRLKELKKKYPNKDLFINMEYGYDDTRNFSVKTMELETDEEYSERVARETKYKQQYLAQCREALKAAGELK